MWIFLNDGFVRKEDAMVSVFDHGFLYGDGVYETLRAYGGRLFRLRQHLARLRRSASLIGLEVPIVEQDLIAVLQEAMKRNNLTDAYLRITVSRGEGAIGLDPRLCARPTVVVISLPLQPYPAELFNTGVSLAIMNVRRNLATALPPMIKSLNFLNNILAKQEASRAGAFDGLMLNAEGHITECTTSNIFFVKNRCVHTPSAACGILDGITREIVLSLAREQEFPTEEGRYLPNALLEADECFLTNTTMEIMPVRDIDKRPIGNEKPGPVTGRLRELFRANLPRFLE
ncbi:MAG TPA: aminotransferase class IV [Nitrospiraceae bacterium]|nr:aminotransferase class IV [Nitrospiraceae bacterium]